MLSRQLPVSRVRPATTAKLSHCSSLLPKRMALPSPACAVASIDGVKASPVSRSSFDGSTDTELLRAASPSSDHHEDVERVLFTEEQVQQRVREMGQELAQVYADKSPLVLGVLTGAFQFTGDLVRAMEPPPRGVQVNFVRASSYGSGMESSGQVTLKVDISPKVVQGRHVLLIEDIVDTGLTLTRLREYILKECGAASCAIVALLDKQERRKVPLQPDYTGFVCPNEFVVGYGLDFDEHYRTLPYIGILKPETYAHIL